MTLDAVGIILSVSAFVLANRWGWGILHNRFFVVGLVALAFLYGALSLMRARSLKLRIALGIIIACIMTILPTVSNMQDRQRSLAQNFINDSALQVEIAGRFLLLGMNPYGTTYEKTDLAKWDYRDDAGSDKNPALFTNIHPPLLLVVSAIQQRVFFKLFHQSDIRWVYLAAYLSLVAIAWYKFRATEALTQFLAFVVVNPFLVSFLATGTNDVVPLACMLASLVFAGRKRAMMSGIFLGLAVATKQTTWIAAPFFLWYLWHTYKPVFFQRFALAAALTAGIFYLPFLFWNAGALLNSLLFYVSASPTAAVPMHPIEGIGFSTLLPELKLVPSIYSTFPFWILEVIALGGTLWAYTRVNIKKERENSLWSYIATATALVWFFSTFLLPSHLGYATVLFALAYVWR